MQSNRTGTFLLQSIFNFPCIFISRQPKHFKMKREASKGKEFFSFSVNVSDSIPYVGDRSRLSQFKRYSL